MKYTLAPRITEKTYRGISDDAKVANVYTFTVSPKARKEEIKKAVEAEYKVTVEDVRTVTLPGKARRFRGIKGSTSSVKKAIVTVAKGQTIAAFDINTGDKAAAKKDKE